MSTNPSDPTIKWNGDSLRIAPNSLEAVTNSGERTVRTNSSGGGDVGFVVTEDVESQKSMLKFALLNDPDDIKKAQQMRDNFSDNLFEIALDGVQTSFKNMTLLTLPPTPYSADGTMELEFEGPPATQSG